MIVLGLKNNINSFHDNVPKFFFQYDNIFRCLLIFLHKQVKHLRLWIFECRDPSHKAFMLGLGAAILLSLAHVIANLLGGCNCLCSQEELQKTSPNRQLSMACLILTW